MPQSIRLRRFLIRALPAFVAVAALLLLPRPSSAAETSLTMTSEAGDYIGAGQSYSYTPGDGTFGASGGPNYVTISFSTPSFSHFWYLNFAAPQGQNLTVGTYTGATRAAFHDPAVPGIDVYGDGRGCNQLIGSFQIKQIQFTNGQLTAFWAKFEQHCEGAAPALRGEIRYNANVVVVVTAPFSQSVQRGSHLEFGVSATDVQNRHVTLSATGVPSGATFTDHNDNTGTFSWTPGIDQAGRYNVSFQGDNGAGTTDVSSTQVDVTGETLLQARSDPGDPVGGGQSFYYTPQVGAFTAGPNYQGGVNVNLNLAVGGSWSMQFAAPNSSPLAPGFYDKAVGFGAAPSKPQLSIGRNFGSCSDIAGAFEVKQMIVEQGQVTSYWARFEQRCGGLDQALEGEIRFNADVRVAVLAPVTRYVHRGETLTFEIAATSPDSGHVDLGAVGLPSGSSFADLGSNRARFTWKPAADQLGDYLIGFTGVRGPNSDASITSIHVIGATSLALKSDPGDPVGRGQSYYFELGDGLFSAVHNAAKGVELSFRGQSFSSWVLDFAAPMNQPLAPGAYEGAIKFPASDSRLPGLLVSQGYPYCNTITGRFDVHEVTFGSGDEVRSFRASFEQHCEGAAPALRGEIRFNADVPISVNAPRRVTVPRGTPIAFDVSAFDVASNPVTLLATGLPQGAGFVDHGDATGRFTWTPAQSGSYSVVFHGRDTAGAEDSTSTRIDVSFQNRPPVAEAGGPYRGIVGKAVFFDGSGSTDADGDSLTYYWFFGDGAGDVGEHVSHVYQSPGAYVAYLTVYDVATSETDTATVVIAPPLAARGFVAGGGTLSLGNGNKDECVQLEPVRGSFALEDVVLSSIVMRSPFTGSVPEIPADPATAIDRDRDHNGVAEISACFAKDDLRRLFESIHVVRSTITVQIQGQLRNGATFSAPFDIDLKAPRHATPALLADADGTHRLVFDTPRAGPLKVQMFDLGGRLVRTLVDDPFAPEGGHEVAIDGRGSSGDVLSSGVYFYRVQSTQGLATGRVPILR